LHLAEARGAVTLKGYHFPEEKLMSVLGIGSVRRALLVCVPAFALAVSPPARAQAAGASHPDSTAAATAGRTIHVPRDHSTIQAAIDAAADGDLVLVSPGTYAGNGNRDLDLHGKRIALRAGQGPEAVVIDCQGSYQAPHRAFYFHTGEGADTVVEGFTLRNGVVLGGGGAVLCEQSSPTLRGCTMEDCTATEWGGAVYLYQSSPVLIDCRFENDNANYGGALNCGSSSSPQLTKCEFRGNSAFRGGGVSCGASAPLLRNCLFLGNSGTQGGALHCDSGSAPVIEGGSLEANSAGQGGGIFCDNFSPVHVDGTRLIGNRAGGGGAGGAVYLVSSSNGTFRNCVFEANRAGEPLGSAGYGGAVYCEGSRALFELDSFTSNRAVGQSTDASGGALYLRFASPTLRKNTFSDNEAFVDPSYSATTLSRGGAIYLEQSSPILGGVAGGGNIFTGNHALAGADVFKEGGPPAVDARWNTFTVFPPSSLYLSPVAGFDVSSGSGLHPAITEDVTVSPLGVDEEGAPGPLRTVRFALSRMTPSAQNPLTIHLEPGTYSSSSTGESFPVQMIEHSRLTRSGADQSVLDAEGANRVIVCDGIADVEISGLNITGGVSGCGGGILCRATSPTIRGNRIEGNAGIWGGGIACLEGSTPLVVRNEIVGNTTLYSPYFALLGGGVFCNASSPVLERNLIAGNTSLDYGGGIMCNAGSHPLLLNNTIAGNLADSGGGLTAWNGSHPTLRNCILWDDVASANPELDPCCGSSATADYSDVAGSWSGTNNLALDPRFVDAPGGDYHLLSDSPCIDAGDPTSPHDPDTTVADMGAFPFFQLARVTRR